MKAAYFINAFFEVDKVDLDSDSARELRKAGNLSPPWRERKRYRGQSMIHYITSSVVICLKFVTFER